MQVRRADVVFVGRVTGIESSPWMGLPGFLPAGHTMTPRTPLEWGRNSRQVSFRIEKAIKGKVDGSISLWTGSGSSECGVAFKPTLTYIVLARYDKEGNLIAEICGGTQWLGYSEARARFGWLTGDLTVSDPEPYDVPTAGISSPILIGGCATAGLSLPWDNFPVVLEVDRDGRVSHFSFTFAPSHCMDSCNEKRESLQRNAPSWRFRPAILDGKPVAVRIRWLWSIQTAEDVDAWRSEQFQRERARAKPVSKLP